MEALCQESWTIAPISTADSIESCIGVLIGFVGLGRMGGNMVRRIMRDSDHEVVGFDVDQGALARAEHAGAATARSLERLVELLRPPRAIWIMAPPGRATRETIEKLGELLQPGDVAADGGNSKWTDSVQHARALGARGVEFVDIGCSGGVWGLEVGYCLMVGGSEPAVQHLSPILDVLAAPPDSAHGPGWARVGPTGAGHYVKMVHNAIEYGLMQAYAEGFDLFDSSDFDLDKAGIAHLWMRGAVVRSWLCELAARSFEADGNDLGAVGGHTEDSGQGRWALEEAIARGVPMPVLASSLHARFYSRGEGELTHRLLAALRAQFGGHPTRSGLRASRSVGGDGT